MDMHLERVVVVQILIGGKTPRVVVTNDIPSTAENDDYEKITGQ
jgi:hypothetical protein